MIEGCATLWPRSHRVECRRGKRRVVGSHGPVRNLFPGFQRRQPGVSPYARSSTTNRRRALIAKASPSVRRASLERTGIGALTATTETRDDEEGTPCTNLHVGCPEGRSPLALQSRFVTRSVDPGAQASRLLPERVLATAYGAFRTDTCCRSSSPRARCASQRDAVRHREAPGSPSAPKPRRHGRDMHSIGRPANAPTSQTCNISPSVVSTCS